MPGERNPKPLYEGYPFSLLVADFDLVPLKLFEQINQLGVSAMAAQRPRREIRTEIYEAIAMVATLG